MKILDALRNNNRFDYFDMYFEETHIKNQRTRKTRVFNGIYRLYYSLDNDGDGTNCFLYDGRSDDRPSTILPIAVREWVENEYGGDDEREIVNYLGEQGIKIHDKSAQFDTSWFNGQPKRNPTPGEESLAQIVATAALYHHRKSIFDKLEELAEEYRNMREEQRTNDYLRYGTP